MKKSPRAYLSVTIIQVTLKDAVLFFCTVDLVLETFRLKFEIGYGRLVLCFLRVIFNLLCVVCTRAGILPTEEPHDLNWLTSRSKVDLNRVHTLFSMRQQAVMKKLRCTTQYN